MNSLGVAIGALNSPDPGTLHADLLNRAIAGDATALQRLLSGYQSRILARLNRKMPPTLARVLAAEDLLQECLLDVFRTISSFRPNGTHAFERWLITIADNRLIDAIRAWSAAKRGGGMVVAETLSGRSAAIPLLELVRVDSHSPSRSMVSHEVEAAVRVAISRLKEDYREAVRLRFLEGLDISEVATRMQRSEWSVHKLCTRGLRQLEMSLGPTWQMFSAN